MKIIKKYINMIKLFSCLIAVNLLLFIVFNLVATTILRDSLPNGLLNPNCKYFTINASQEFIDFSFIEENDCKVSLVKQPQSDGLLDYQIIYSNISFPINSGRDFNSYDFKSGKNTVLIDILDYSKLLIIMLILILTIYIIFIYYISSFWVNANKRYLALQWILGNSRIIIQFSFTYLIFYVFSIALSYILSKIIIPNTFSFVIGLTIICMFIELFVTICKPYSLINCSINDLLEDD